MSWSNHRKIQRVPALLLAEEKKKKKQEDENDYYPKVVSIGPYHHDKPELAQVEAFKPMAAEMFVRDPEEKEYFYDKVLEVIGEVRNCYEEESVAKHSDAGLPQMMLRDASLIIIEIEIDLKLGDKGELYHKSDALTKHLGRLTRSILFGDFILVENQIPLLVIQLLIELRHGQGETKINKYIEKCIFGEDPRRAIPSPSAALHLLESMYVLLTSKPVDESETNSSFCGLHLHSTPPTAYRGGTLPRRHPARFKPSDNANANANGSWDKMVTHSFRRVMDLKAKGIYFRPSATPLLMDVKFESRLFHSKLHLHEVAGGER